MSGLDDAFALVAGRFFRREVRLRARACVAGMLSGLERKTGWSLAEHVGSGEVEGQRAEFLGPGRSWAVTRSTCCGPSSYPRRIQTDSSARLSQYVLTPLRIGQEKRNGLVI